MALVLRIDPRSPAYDSTSDSSPEPASGLVVATDVETADWRPLCPGPIAPPEALAFVDGVQRIDLRVSAEGDGWPVPGILASYAAGAVCPGSRPPVCQVTVERALILAEGCAAPALGAEPDNGTLVYRLSSCAGADFDALSQQLGELRAALEARVVRSLQEAEQRLIVVDGRLPPHTAGLVVGLIKTVRDLKVSAPDQVSCIAALKEGERSPVFLAQRSARPYYSWFVCLRNPGPLDPQFSGVARMEMNGSQTKAEVFRVADITASVLPAYASTPERDDRAPQNLLPVGQLERELRHRLGDPEYISRLIHKTFSQGDPAWTR